MPVTSKLKPSKQLRRRRKLKSTRIRANNQPKLTFDRMEDRLLLAADFGDAPASYSTLLIDNGPRHEIIVSAPTLGVSVDAETDGTPTANAAGDDVANSPPDDEGGVQFTAPIAAGVLNATVTVSVENAPSGAQLDAWLDFGADGTFDAGDQIANNLTVSNGENVVTFAVPATAVAGNTFARFRLSTAGDLDPTGPAADGEVEDYHVTISALGSNAEVGTLDTQHYIPPFYAVSGLSSGFIGNQYLALSTPETSPINVHVTNASGTVNQTVTISKSSPALLNFSAAPYGGSSYSGLGIVDDNGLNQVNASDGVILTSSEPFYANSRQLSGFQAEALTSKGQSALGTRFRAGLLNTLTTGDNNDSVRGHFISVMASEDNTTVNFSEVGPGIVFRDGSGTLSGTPGPVTLNAGESYVVGVRLSDVAAANQNNLNGTLITSDKPIAVNTGSWTAGNGGGQDVGFDQILPTNLLGNRYILAKGGATTEAVNLETPIVIADTDNTQIFVNGAATPITTINAGEYFIIPGTNYTASGTMVIDTSEPAYVYQSTAGVNSSVNVGMNFAVAVSDALVPQEVVIGNVNQLGDATVKIVAPTSAAVIYNGSALTGGVAIVGAPEFSIYTVLNAAGTVSINSTEPLFISLTTVSGAATSAAYFSGVPNTVAVDDIAGSSVDTPVVIDVQANDNAGAAFTVQSATDPANGSVLVNPNGTITFTPDQGFLGTDTFDYTISDGATTDSATVAVTYGPNTFDFTTGTYSSVEGNVTNTTNVVVVQRRGDISAANSINVNLFAGAGDPATPGVDFTAGPLLVEFAAGESFKAVPIEILGDIDVEPNEIISLSLFGVGVGSLHPTATLTLVDDDFQLPPVIDVDQTGVTVDEGIAAGNTGTFSDPESNPVTLSASIGTVVDAGGGVWSWSYDTDDGPAESQTVTITADDGIGFDTVNFLLTVDNVAPTATLANNGSVIEGNSATVTFSGASDPSVPDTTAGFRYAYDFDNNGTFEVGDGTYAGSATNAIETVPIAFLPVGTNTVNARIIDKDGGFRDYQTDVVVEPDNSPPDAVNDVLGEVTLNEDASNTDITGSVGGSGILGNDSDPDGDPLTITEITDGVGTVTTATPGSITLANGAIVSLDASGNVSFDPDGQFESLAVGDSDTSSSFSYTVSDGNGETDTASVIVTITGENDAPTIPVDDTVADNEIDEGATGTVGIDVSSTDVDAGTTITFSLSDDANGRFQIDFNSGVVTVADALLLNYEDATSHNITVVANDGSGTANATSSQTFTINVNNVAPTVPVDDEAATTNEVEENAATGTTVGITAASTDPNGTFGGGDVTFSLSDNAGGRFQIDASTGVVTVANGSLLDYETAISHNITVVANDGSGAANATSSQTFTINVLNVTAMISGTVFVDANQDGDFDGGSETGIDGVTITLLDEAFAEIDMNVTSMGGVYAFEVDDEFGTYRIVETQPTGVDDGNEIAGSSATSFTLNPDDGGGPLNDVIELTLGVDADNNGQPDDASDWDFSETGEGVGSGDTATIGYWQNKNGRALIQQGGDDLVNWLNANFGNIFGTTFTDAGSDAAEVADFYKNEFFKKKLKGTAKVDAQFMSTAFATFFTSSNLSGGSAAASYGFTVTETGIGTKVVNVGSSGAAFDVDDDTDITIMAMLLATNRFTGVDTDTDGSEDYSHVYDANGDGVLDAAEKAMRAMANDIYSWLNETGDI